MSGYKASTIDTSRSNQATVNVRDEFFGNRISAAMTEFRQAWSKSTGEVCPYTKFADVPSKFIFGFDEMNLNPHEGQDKVLVKKKTAGKMNQKKQRLARKDTTDGKPAKHVSMGLFTCASGLFMQNEALGGPPNVNFVGACAPYLIKTSPSDKLTEAMIEGMLLEVDDNREANAAPPELFRSFYGESHFFGGGGVSSL